MNFSCLLTTYEFIPCTTNPIVMHKTMFVGIVLLEIYVDDIILARQWWGKYFSDQSLSLSILFDTRFKKPVLLSWEWVFLLVGKFSSPMEEIYPFSFLGDKITWVLTWDFIDGGLAKVLGYQFSNVEGYQLLLVIIRKPI